MRKYLTLLIMMVLLLSACVSNGDPAETQFQSSSMTTVGECVENPTEIATDDTSVPTEAPTEASFEFTGKTIYVDAIAGNDTNDGAEDAPYQSISAAASQLLPGDTLIVKDGIYREKIAFPSGTKKNPIAIKAAEGAQPVICGTDVITAEWSVYSENIYVASVSDSVFDLFVNDIQMNLARWPNTPVNDYLHMEFAMMMPGSDSNQISDSALPDVDLTGARVNMIPGDEYISYSRLIASCEPGKTIVFNEPVKAAGDDPVGYDPYVPQLGNKYYVLDALALLDAPGEWYYDQDAGQLYLYTENGDSPENYQISHRARTHGIDISSSEYVHISGIDLFACAIDGSQAQHCILDDVNVRYVDYFIDTNGYDTMYTQRSNQLGGEGNLWKNSYITNAAGNGILLSGKNNVVENCKITNVNWSAGYLANVKIEGEGNTVKNCTLSDSGRFIIYHSGSVKARILNNDITGASILTRDCGAVYAWGTDANGTEIAYNFIHDNECVGVYLDNNCSGINIHHNIITKNFLGLQLNSQMLECMIVNNTVVGNNKLQESYCYPNDTPSMAKSVVVNNVYSGVWVLAGGNTAPTFENNMRCSDLNPDLSLPAGHAAIDAGMILAPYTDNYWGSAPDLGALESGADAFTYGSTIE